MVPGDKLGSSIGTSFNPIDRSDRLEDLPSADTEMHLLVGEAAILAGVRSPHLKEMFDYYLSLRPDEGGMPLRERFSPAELPRHLPNIFLVETVTVDDGAVDYRYSVFGTALALLFGTEMTGKLVSEYPGENRAERSRKILDHVSTLKRPVRTAGNFTSKNGMLVFGESIVMPFGKDGVVTHILADLDYDQVG